MVTPSHGRDSMRRDEQLATAAMSGDVSSPYQSYEKLLGFHLFLNMETKAQMS